MPTTKTEALELWPEDIAPADPDPRKELGAVFDEIENAVNLADYRDDFIGFWVDILGMPREALEWSALPGYADHDWDGTVDPLAEMARALVSPDYGHVVVTSGTGTGKTFTAAAVVLWWHATRPDSLVATFAPKEAQLESGIWGEIGKLWPRFHRHSPESRLSSLFIGTGAGSDIAGGSSSAGAVGKWTVIARTTAVRAGETSATKAQGLHAAEMLLVLDEAPGIHRAVVDALVNTCSNPRTNRILALGNPDSEEDTLAWLGRFPGEYPTRVVRASGYDHPNVVLQDPHVVPGAVTASFIRQMESLDEQEEGLLQRVTTRVRGMAPTDREDALIRRAWIREAMDRGKDPETAATFRQVGAPAMGVDVARTGVDKSCLAIGEGACLHTLRTIRREDLTELADDIAVESRSLGITPEYVGIDSDGLGAGAVDALNRLHRIRAREVRGSAKPVTVSGAHEKFRNLRSQMWFQMRRDLQAGRITLPDDKDLLTDLLAPRFKMPNGVIEVESKEEFKKRLGRSPDKADAAVYWNWVRQQLGSIPAVFTSGEPIRLGLMPGDPRDAVRRRPSGTPIRLGVL